MMRKSGHRAIKGAGELGNEKRLRAAAEEKARGLEVVNSKLRREAAAKPAFQQRERDRSKMISEDYEEHLAAANLQFGTRSPPGAALDSAAGRSPSPSGPPSLPRTRVESLFFFLFLRVVGDPFPP